MYLPTTLDDDFPKILRIETIVPSEIMSGLMLVRITTEDGLQGFGETYYAPETTATLIHEWIAHRLLGSDPRLIESHWRFLYERFANFGGFGVELRAISAIDLALWDLAGKRLGRPIYELFGGAVRSQIKVYNSCGNPLYGRNTSGSLIWPGYGSPGTDALLNDSYHSLHHPERLVEELLADGFTALKMWAFDALAHETGGKLLDRHQWTTALRPLLRMREVAGDRLDIIVDGHGFFSVHAALQLARALEPIEPLWLEDFLKLDNLAMLADLRRNTRSPIGVSEMLLRRAEFQQVIQAGAVDVVIIDPTWAGGLSETLRIARLAESSNLPVTTHDCTGPLTFFAGLHINASVPACCYQEVVRAHVRSFYDQLIDTNVSIQDGHVALPSAPGLGAALHAELFEPGRYAYRCSEFRT